MRRTPWRRSLMAARITISAARAVAPSSPRTRSTTSRARIARRYPSLGRVTFTCPMHPEIVQDGPGDCPICGMALEPAGVPATDAAPNPELVDFARRFRIGAALTVPLLVLAMGPMLGLPIREWTGERAVPAVRPSSVADDRGSGDEPVFGIGRRQRAEAQEHPSRVRSAGPGYPGRATEFAFPCSGDAPCAGIRWRSA